MPPTQKKQAQQLWQDYLNRYPLPKIHVATGNPCPILKAWLKSVNHYLDHELQHHTVIDDVLYFRSLAMDWLLQALFDCFELPKLSVHLFALGGYGRCELALHSDVDILLLTDDQANLDKQQTQLEYFIAALWDIGIQPAVSVHKINDINNQTIADISTATSWLESRLIIGDKIYQDLPYHTIKKAWQVSDFFAAKMQEVHARYLAHDGTEYNLEPNLKTAPGGLRDIHTLLWLAKIQFAHLNAHDNITQLITTDFLTSSEIATLHTAARFFWRVRHHLHTLTQKNEDRLLFTYQKTLAKRMGFGEAHDNSNAPPERLMKEYYRHAMTVASLSKMLCELFAVKYLYHNRHDTHQILDDNFMLVSFQPHNHKNNTHNLSQLGSVIALRDEHHTTDKPGVFFRQPATILQLFLLMGQQGIKSIAPNTSRQLRIACRQIDDTYRENPQHRQLFLDNLKESNYLFCRLKLMKRHGVLGRYLPDFGKIMGLMQYDLFHRYTVDAHTLRLIRILHRLSLPQAGDFSLVGQVYQNLDTPYLLVIVALFHDIAKGRGGDHSILGAKLVKQFCSHHNLNNIDSQLIIWLVREHLTMSLTAQKKDIHDPYILANFADFVGDIRHLDYLYVLTVVDMNATNSQLWNNWRATLLKQLYQNTHYLLRLDNHNDKPTAFIQARKNLAINKLTPAITAGKYQIDDIKALWASFGDEYFAKENGDTIAWHSDTILSTYTPNQPLINLRPHPDSEMLNALQLLIYTSNQDRLFATIVGVLDGCGYSILEANIGTFGAWALDTFVILSRTTPTKATQESQQQANILIETLKQYLNGTQRYQAKTIHQPYCALPTATNQLQHFDINTQITINIHDDHQHQLHLITKDRSSLLAKIGSVFDQLNIWVHRAKITTLGERVEDLFVISDQQNQTLNQERLTQLTRTLKETLDY